MSTTEPDYDAEKKLPEGKTCSDCVHAPRCAMLMGARVREWTSCDFWPRRFVLQVKAP